MLVGLDVGTTATRCAVYDDDPRVVANADGRQATPTAVSVEQDGSVLVGNPARRRATQYPDRTVTDLKDRLRTGESVTVDGTAYPPEVLTAAVIEKAVRGVERAHSEAVEGIVVAVPSGFGLAQCQRLADAVEIAGYTVERFLPALAAVGCTMAKHDRTLLVCDVGGGDFEAGILELGGGVVEPVTSRHDLSLGGRDFDADLARYLTAEVGADVDDPRLRGRIRELARGVRADLSSRSRTQVSLPPLGADRRTVSLDRTDLGEALADPLDRMRATVTDLLDAVGYGNGGIDEVRLVGGATATPLVADALEDATGLPCRRRPNADTTAVRGAAIQAGILSGAVDDIVVLDVLTRALDVASRGGDESELLIDRETVIPTTEQTVVVVPDDAATAPVRLVEDQSADAHVLADATLSSASPGEAVWVELSVHAERMVYVTAEAFESDEQADALFDPTDSRFTDAGREWARSAVLDGDPSGRPDTVKRDPQPFPASGTDGELQLPLATERVETVPDSFGLALADGSVRKVLDGGATTPERNPVTVTTTDDEQTTLNVRVLRLDGDDPADHTPVTSFDVTGIPPAPAGERDITVGFELDRFGVLTVSVTDDTRTVRDTTRVPVLVEVADRPDPSDDGRVRPNRRPAVDEIESLLTVRDDLTRAIAADADAPEDVQSSLSTLQNRLADLLSGELSDPLADAVDDIERDLERIVEASPESLAELRASLEAVRDGLDETLEATGGNRIDPAPGTAVDPERHRVTARVPGNVPRGTIVAVEQLGYERDGTIHKPAHVTVSDGSDTTAQAAGETSVPERIPDGPSLDSVSYEQLSFERVLGRGGDADVRLATVDDDGETMRLAVKEPRFEGTLHEETMARFREEAETWQALDDHDHIVDVVDWGTSPVPWLALEHMDGGDLADRIGDLAFPRALWTALGIVRGVRHAHAHGLVHLDIKPENVLFRAVEGAWDVPKITDFGLAKLMLSDPVDSRGLSPRYAAPEQFDDAFGSTDTRTDVYQLGVVLYELFTGEVPFSGLQQSVATAVVEGDVTPPTEREPTVPDRIDDIVLTAMATERSDRYESVLYLRDDLAELAASRLTDGL